MKKSTKIILSGIWILCQFIIFKHINSDGYYQFFEMIHISGALAYQTLFFLQLGIWGYLIYRAAVNNNLRRKALWILGMVFFSFIGSLLYIWMGEPTLSDNRDE